jgi:exfoliative toxin A/B
MLTSFLKKLPYPIAGLMLGLAALGNLVAGYGVHYRYILGGTATVIFVLLLAKVLVFPASLREAFAQPVVCSVLPTFSMGTAILTGYLRQWAPGPAQLLWFTALALHLALIALFTVRYVLSFKIKQVFPSWFIVYVGLATFSVTAPAFGQGALGQALFWAALVSYFLLLPVVIYRCAYVKEVPPPALPTLVIFTAPSSLALAGYLSSFVDRSPAIVYLLTVCTVLSFAFVLSRLPALLKLPFFPSYSAFTFPFVITAIALKGTAAYLNNTGRGIELLTSAIPLLELWALAAVIYVLFRYVHFLAAASPAPAPQPQIAK